MKAPIIAAEELQWLNSIRSMEKAKYPDFGLSDYFDNGRTIPHIIYLEEYAEDEDIVDALTNGEILTTVSSDGDFVLKLFLAGDGMLRGKPLKDIPVERTT